MHARKKNQYQKPLNQQVIVITGATSGIGLATAQKAAALGAKLVLAARNEDDLHEVEEQIRNEDGEVIVVKADVGVRDDIRRVAEAAISHFGRIDTWINNAGVSIWGKLTEVSDADSRRLFETNFWGMVNGSLEAVEHLKESGGTLINLGSVASETAFPLQGMYCASKHAIKAFTDTLRLELEKENLPISVTLIKPAAIDTPFPEHAKNYMAEQPNLPPPVYHPDEVAYAILKAAESPIRDIFIGSAGPAMSTFGKFMPGTSDELSKAFFFDQQKRDEVAHDREGTLYQAGHGVSVRGTHPGHVMKTSLYTRAKLNPLLAGAAVGIAGFALAKALKSRESKYASR